MTLRQPAAISIEDVRAAAKRVYALAVRTPLIRNQPLTDVLGARTYLKAEILQRTGSFKVRGATNRLAVLADAEKHAGVITASAGNHAQGVALAAATLGIPCTIVMPREASLAKVQATRSYGVEVVLEGGDYAEAAEHARLLAGESGRTFIPAFNDPLVIAGQGTIALEIIDDLPDVGQVVVPVGGGGLAAGVALAVKSLRPGCRVIGVQVESAPAAYHSYHSGAVEQHKVESTIADGIAVGAPGDWTLPVLRECLDGIVLVDDEAVASAMLFLAERCKLVVEGAGATGVAALLKGVVQPVENTVAILSGGNIDIHLLHEVIEHGLSLAGRFLSMTLTLPDRPGQLARVLNAIAEARGNVLTIDHRRTGPDLPLYVVEIALVLETRDAGHGEEIVAALCALGYRPAIGAPTARRGLA
jgi:threonine dehydratase